MKRESATKTLSLVLLLCVMLPCVLGSLSPTARLFFPFDTLFLLLFGWLIFIGRVINQMSFDWIGVATAIVTVLLLAIGLHWFCRWFCARSGQRATVRQWKGSWTNATVWSVVLMFCAGTAMIGVVHQTVWLLTSKAPLLYSTTHSRGNLKIMGIGLHNHHDREGAFPAGATFDNAGRPLHSWVTRMLPYMDGPLDRELAESIRLDLAWNDPLHKQVFEQSLPNIQNSAVYSPDEPVDFDSQGYALSHYAANVLVMGPKRPLRIDDISDGTSNTLMVGDVNAQFRPWGDPISFRDVRLGINKSPHGFGSPYQGGAYFLRADGSAQFISEDVDIDLLKATATPAGGEADTIPGGIID